MFNLFLITVVLSFFRILGTNSITFQAIAHMFVGGLIGAYMVSRKPQNTTHKYGFLFLAVGITIVETICFLVSKGLFPPLSSWHPF